MNYYVSVSQPLRISETWIGEMVPKTIRGFDRNIPPHEQEWVRFQAFLNRPLPPLCPPPPPNKRRGGWRWLFGLQPA